MSNSKWDSENEDPELASGQGSERHSCHAELVSASRFALG